MSVPAFSLPVVLGSSSTGRKEILTSLGISFTTISPGIDEKAIRSADPKELVLKLAHAKADAVLSKLTTPSLVICCDQVIVCDGRLREKPESVEQAREYLRSYAEHPAECVCGVVVVNSATGKRAAGVDVAYQHFHPLPDHAIEQLIRGPAMYCAGGFAVEEMAQWDRGCQGEKSTVIGLPATLTLRLLREADESSSS